MKKKQAAALETGGPFPKGLGLPMLSWDSHRDNDPLSADRCSQHLVPMRSLNELQVLVARTGVEQDYRFVVLEKSFRQEPLVAD